MKTEKTLNEGHTNPDAITGAPASHPGATAIGAASGAGTGAAIGAIGGPVGAVIGAVAGGIVGGLTGHGIGEWNDPSDAAYWKDEYKNRSYYDKGADYDRDVVPALQYGSSLGAPNPQVSQESSTTTSGVAAATKSNFDSLEGKASQEWDKVRGQSKYSYQQARNAISDAFNHKIQQHEDQMQARPDQVRNS